jgi:hypothetical protein
VQVLKSALSVAPLVHADLEAAVVRHGEVGVSAPVCTHVRLEIFVPRNRGDGVVAQNNCAGAEVGFDEPERGEGYGCPDCVVGCFGLGVKLQPPDSEGAPLRLSGLSWVRCGLTVKEWQVNLG